MNKKNIIISSVGGILGGGAVLYLGASTIVTGATTLAIATLLGTIGKDVSIGNITKGIMNDTGGALGSLLGSTVGGTISGTNRLKDKFIKLYNKTKKYKNP